MAARHRVAPFAIDVDPALLAVAPAEAIHRRRDRDRVVRFGDGKGLGVGAALVAPRPVHAAGVLGVRPADATI